MPYEIRSIDAPSTVAVGEEFTPEAEVCCVDPDERTCPDTDAVITVGGEEVFRDIFGLIPGCVTADPTDPVTIDEPGTYTILVTVGGESDSREIEATGDNGNGGNGGNGGGEPDGDRADLLRTVAVAGVGVIGGLGGRWLG